MLAVQGKLVPQDPKDEPASELLKKVRVEKDRLIAEGKIKRDKPLAEITDEERPFDLPAGWEWVRLNALLQKIGAGSTPLGGKEVYVSTGVKFLRSQNVWNEGLRLEGVAYIPPATHAKMSGTVVVANDLLFNITGASIGRCAVVPSDFDEANVSQHVTILRTVIPALNAFLHKVLVSRHVQQTVMDVQVGVSREGLSIAKLGQFLIPVPPLAEQSRIVTRVEELMQLCDALETQGQLLAEQHARLVSTLFGSLLQSAPPGALVDNWQRIATHFDLLLDRPEAVDVLEQTILQLAVRGLLVPQDPVDEPASELLKKIASEKDKLIAEKKIRKGKSLPDIADDEKFFELPETWAWARLNSIGDWGAGATPSRTNSNYYGGKIPWFKSGELTSDHIVESEETVTEAALRECSLRLNQPGDVLIAMYGATIGKTSILDVVGTTNQAVCACTPFAGMANTYLLLLMKALKPYFISQGAGGAQPNISREKVINTVIGLPPLTEQSRICTRVNDLQALCSDLRLRLADTVRTCSGNRVKRGRCRKPFGQVCCPCCKW